MADVFSRAKRSEVMAAIRSRGNKDTELVLAGVFRGNGISGWRRQVRIKCRIPNSEFRTEEGPAVRLSVRPDFVFPKLKLAVFVDGCFWHGCPKHGTRPKGNAAFWREKISRNRARDRRVNRELRKAGWRVLRIWGHELARRNQARLLRRIIHRLHG